METPTARILRQGHFRVGVSQVDPYRYYYGAISPLPGLEIDGRVTELLGVPDLALGASYGDYKDKAIDFKWQFLRERKWLPAFALGINDPQGTRLYASQYIVASKQFYPFDITVGFGNGRYGKQPLPSAGEGVRAEIFSDGASWVRDGQFFGGIQFAATRWLTFMAEYSPIHYDRQTVDPAQPVYFQNNAPSPINLGIRLKPWDWLEADLSYQRGNKIGVNLSVAFDLERPVIPIYTVAYREKPDLQTRRLRERIVRGLSEMGFSGIGIRKDEDELWIEAANNRYLYPMKAVGAALRTINGILSASGGQGIKTLHFILTDNGIPLLEFVTATEDMNAYYSEQFKLNEFLYLSEMRTDVWKTPDVKRENWRYFDYTLKPDVKFFLNDPSGFFRYRIGASVNALYHPWKGSTLAIGVLGYPVNTVSSSNTPSLTPVRTDLVNYQQQKTELGMLLFSQIQKYRYEIYGKLAVGYLEEEYAGLDWEVARPLMGGRFTLGFSGSVVRKREPETLVGLKTDDWKDWYVTGFLNLRLNIPEAEVNIDLKNGQFLAGDRGTQVVVSRNFNGIILSAWYSVTDTSVFKDSFNIGYHDKGIAISIPLETFTGRDSRTVYKTGISPWTRDVAQDIGHFDNLLDYIGRNVRVYMDKDTKMIK